ncbi:A-kinase anchor protein 9 [Yarrowia sp. C11]|nr:A-kinase anchor protein 9 [Yarrowia sp. C11]KAG5371205.1 A-kinase anchor protein 9 [Yarrowia sp. E02]
MSAMDPPKPPNATNDVKRDTSFHVATPDRSVFIGADDSPISENGDQFFLSGWNGRVDDYSYQSIFSSDDGDSLTGSQFRAVLASAPHVFVRPPFEAVGESASEDSDSDTLPHGSIDTTIDKNVHSSRSASPTYTKDLPNDVPTTTLGAHQEASHIPQDIPDPRKQEFLDYTIGSESELSSCPTTPTIHSANRHRLSLSPDMKRSSQGAQGSIPKKHNHNPTPKKKAQAGILPVDIEARSGPADSDVPVAPSASSSAAAQSSFPSPSPEPTDPATADERCTALVPVKAATFSDPATSTRTTIPRTFLQSQPLGPVGSTNRINRTPIIPFEPPHAPLQELWDTPDAVGRLATGYSSLSLTTPDDVPTGQPEAASRATSTPALPAGTAEATPVAPAPQAPVQESRLQEELPSQVLEERHPSGETSRPSEEDVLTEGPQTTATAHTVDEEGLQPQSDTFEQEEHTEGLHRTYPLEFFMELFKVAEGISHTLSEQNRKLDALGAEVGTLQQNIRRVESGCFSKRALEEASCAKLMAASYELMNKLNSIREGVDSTEGELKGNVEPLQHAIQEVQSQGGLYDERNVSLSLQFESSDDHIYAVSIKADCHKVEVDQLIKEKNDLTAKLLAIVCGYSEQKGKEEEELADVNTKLKDSIRGRKADLGKHQAIVATLQRRLEMRSIIAASRSVSFEEPAKMSDPGMVELTRRLDEALKRAKLLTDEKDSLQQTVTALKSENSKLRDVEKDAAKGVSDSNAKESSLKDKISSLRKDLESSQELLRQRDDALNMAEQQMSQAQADVEAKQGALTEKNMLLSEKSARVSTLESELKSSKIEKSQMGSTLTSSQQEVATLRDTVSRLESTTKDKDSEILKLSNRLKVSERQTSVKIQSLEGRLKSANHELKQLEAKHLKTTTMLQAAQSLKECDDKQLAEAQDQIRQLENQQKELEAQILSAQKGADSSHKELEGQIRALAGQLMTCTAYTPVDVMVSCIQKGIDSLKTTQEELKAARVSASAQSKENSSCVESLRSELTAEREAWTKERQSYKTELDSYVFMSKTLQKENEGLVEAAASHATELLEASQARARLEASERVLSEKCKSLEAQQKRENTQKAPSSSDFLLSAELQMLKREKQRLQVCHDSETGRLKLELERERQRRLDSEKELSQERARESERYREPLREPYRDYHRDYESDRRRDSGDNVRVNINIGTDSGYGGKDPALVSLARQKIEMFLANERYRRCAGSMKGAAHDDEYNRLQLYLVDSMGIEHARKILTMLTRQIGQPVTALPKEIDKLVGHKEVLSKSLEFIDDVVRYSNNDPDGPGIRAEPGSVQWSSNLNSEMSHLKRSLYKAHTGRKLRY